MHRVGLGPDQRAHELVAALGPGDRDIDAHGAQPAQHLDRRERRLDDLGVVAVAVEEEVCRHADAQATDAAAEQAAWVGGGGVEQRGGHGCQLPGRAGERPHHVVRPGDGEDARGRDPPRRWPQRGDTVQRRRDAHRAAGISAECHGAQVGRHRRARAGTGAARDARRVPGVVAVVDVAVAARHAVGQLVQGQLGQHDAAGGPHAAHALGVRGGRVGEERRADGGGHPRHVDVVLHAHRHAVEWPQQLATGTRCVGCGRLGQRRALHDSEGRADRAVDQGDAVEAGARQLDR